MEVTLSVNFPKGKCCDGSLNRKERMWTGFGQQNGWSFTGFTIGFVQI